MNKAPSEIQVANRCIVCVFGEKVDADPELNIPSPGKAAHISPPFRGRDPPLRVVLESSGM